MGTLAQDLRYGLRMLVRSPGFTAVAVLTLALGIGANTAIFSLIDSVMLRSLPVRDQSRLVVIRWTAHKEPSHNHSSSFGDCEGDNDKNPSGCSLPFPFFDLVRSKKEVFSGATAFAGPASLVLSGNGQARMARGEMVTGDYFSTLGVGAAVGRTLDPEDDLVSASPAVVLSYDFWQSAFGGERSAMGRTISLNSVPFTIVGVTEPNFTSLTPGKAQDMFLPLSMLPRLNVPWGSASEARELNSWWLVIVARLKPGIPLSQAQAAASLLFRNEMLHAEKPLSKASDDPAIVLMPVQSGLSGRRGFFSKPLFVLMFAVGLVLLIACANVAGLLLSRAAARQKEMAIRLALGAGRARMVRQLLTESVTLSLLGGALGVLLAYWGVYAMTALILGSSDRPFPFVVGPDWRVLVFTIFISLLTGILFGVAPALSGTRLDLTPALKENARTLPGGEIRHGRRFHLGKALVVIQVALSMIVLTGAGLFVRTLQKLRSVNPGFDTHNLLLFGIDPTLEKYSDAKILGLYRDLQARLAALPGVISVTYSSDALLSGSLWTSDLHVEGQAQKTNQEVDMLAAGPDFFKTLRIPLIGGRTFTAVDFQQASEAAAVDKASQQPPEPRASASEAGKPPAVGPPIPVLVNLEFVRKYFPDQNPLGRSLTQGDSSGESGEGLAAGKPKSKGWVIIGVAADTKYDNLRREIHPTVFVPVTGGGAHFELRAASNPAALIPVVRKSVYDTDSNLPIFDLRTQSQHVEELLTQERVIARLASVFGLLALLLACVGLYGLLSYEVAQRTREIGIRMALGAESGDVLRRIAGQGIRVTVLGLAAGIAGCLALTRFLASLLYGIQPSDPVTFLLVSTILFGVALLASYIPARRATRVDPMVALRYE